MTLLSRPIYINLCNVFLCLDARKPQVMQILPKYTSWLADSR